MHFRHRQTDRWTGTWHKREMYILHLALMKARFVGLNEWRTAGLIDELVQTPGKQVEVGGEDVVSSWVVHDRPYDRVVHLDTDNRTSRRRFDPPQYASEWIVGWGRQRGYSIIESGFRFHAVNLVSDSARKSIRFRFTNLEQVSDSLNPACIWRHLLFVYTLAYVVYC